MYTIHISILSYRGSRFSFFGARLSIVGVDPVGERTFVTLPKQSQECCKQLPRNQHLISVPFCCHPHRQPDTTQQKLTSSQTTVSLVNSLLPGALSISLSRSHVCYRLSFIDGMDRRLPLVKRYRERQSPIQHAKYCP